MVPGNPVIGYRGAEFAHQFQAFFPIHISLENKSFDFEYHCLKLQCSFSVITLFWWQSSEASRILKVYKVQLKF